VTAVVSKGLHYSRLTFSGPESQLQLTTCLLFPLLLQAIPSQWESSMWVVLKQAPIVF